MVDCGGFAWRKVFENFLKLLLFFRFFKFSRLKKSKIVILKLFGNFLFDLTEKLIKQKNNTFSMNSFHEMLIRE